MLRADARMRACTLATNWQELKHRRVGNIWLQSDRETFHARATKIWTRHLELLDDSWSLLPLYVLALPCKIVNYLYFVCLRLNSVVYMRRWHHGAIEDGFPRAVHSITGTIVNVTLVRRNKTPHTWRPQTG
jgi:hypothetical protein